MTKIWSIYQDVEGDLEKGEIVYRPANPSVSEGAMLHAIYSCDGLLSAIVGWLLAKHRVRIEREHLAAVIENSPVYRAAMAECRARRRDLCEEVLLMHVKSGSEKAARWLLERYDPQNFGNGAVTPAAATEQLAAEVPVLQAVSNEDWIAKFSALRQRREVH